MHNPYYNPEKLGCKSISFEQGGDYEFDTFLVLVTDDGRVFQTTDSGCSCPTPFEGYEGESVEQCGMEQIHSMDRLMELLTQWQNEPCTEERSKLMNFTSKYLK